MQAVEELNASSAQITALLKARQAERAAARAAAAAQQSSPTYSWVQGSGQLGWPVSGELPLHMAIVHIRFGALQFIILALILVLMKVHLFMLQMVVLLLGRVGWVAMVMP